MMSKNKKIQQGVVLITGLIFLLVLTIIGISSMGNTAMSERMTQNFRDASTAFQAAEAALGDGESWVSKQTSLTAPVTTCSTPPCTVWQYNSGTNFLSQTTSWWQSNGVPFSSIIYGVTSQPVYYMEQFSFVPYDLSPDSISKGHGYYYYRITAYGTGATANTRSIVQSIFATQYN